MADLWVPGWTVRKFTDPKSFLPNENLVACAHTQVGSYAGSWSWGNQDGHPYAHGYIRGSGEGVGAWPVNLKGAANLEGNPYVFAVETEDVNPLYFPAWNLTCGNVPAWTDGQVETLTKAFAWWCLRFKRPAALIPDAKPGRQGLAYHRFGVPNSPEWVTGADKWTKSAGKCCPDWRRIAQFKQEVVPGVKRLVDGVPLPPPPPVTEDDDMVVFRRLSNRSAMSLASGKLVQISGEPAVDRYKTEGVPVVWLDEDEWNRYVGAYGPVH